MSTPAAIFNKDVEISGNSNLIIKSGGNLGIGKTPSSQIDVSGSGNFSESLTVQNTKIGGNYPNFASFAHSSNNDSNNYSLLQSGSGKTFLNASSGQSIAFSISHAEKMVLDKDGNIGIGKTNPSTKLDVDGSGNFSGNLAVSGTITGNVTGDLTGNASSATELETGRNIGGVLFDGTSNIDLSGVNQTGNQNIERSSNLTLKSNSGHVFIESSGNLIFKTNGGERMRIKDDGSMGIGKTNPGKELDVSGDGKFSGDLNVVGELNTNNITYSGGHMNIKTATDDKEIIFTTNDTPTVRIRRGYLTGEDKQSITFSDIDTTGQTTYTDGSSNTYNTYNLNGNCLRLGSNSGGINLFCHANGNTLNNTGDKIPEGFNFFNDETTNKRLLMYIAGQNGNVGIRGNLVLGKGGKHTSGSYKLDVDGSGNFDGNLNVGGTISGDLSGNASSATKLQTARNIGGVSFNGSASINLPGVNQTGNQNTSGNAATATTLQTARTIGGVSFNGSANIDLPGVNQTGNQNTSGNAATATTLQTTRNIGGVPFNGSASINLPGVNQTGNQDITKNNLTLTSNSGSIFFKSSTNERMRILSSGNVGIGTTTPGEKLQVNGIIKTNGLKGYTISSNFLFQDFNDTSRNIGVDSEGDDIAVANIFEMGNTYASGANFICDSNGNSIRSSVAPEGFAFYSRLGNSGDPRLLMYITGKDGNAGIRGNLVLGKEQKHNSSSYKLDVSGDGNFDGNIDLNENQIIDCRKINLKNGTHTGVLEAETDSIKLSGLSNLKFTINSNGTNDDGGEFQILKWSNSTPIVKVNQSSQMGIGKTPSKELDVSGDGNFSGDLTIDGSLNINNGLKVYYDGTQNQILSSGNSLYLKTENGNNSQIQIQPAAVKVYSNRLVYSNGNIITLTVVPGHLDISGDVSFSGDLDIGGNINSGTWNGSNIAQSKITNLETDLNNLESDLNAKQATITGAATTITSSDLTANRALISNGSGKVAVSSITTTELGHLDGLTSNIKTQLDGKVNNTGNETISGEKTFSNDITFNNDITLSSSSEINFGNSTRQNINLHSKNYGIGVETQATYFRSGNSFRWYTGGTHSGSSANGKELMGLDSSSNLTISGGTITASKLSGNIEVEQLSGTSNATPQYLLFSGGNTGYNKPRVNNNIKVNPNNGTIEATNFSGNGSSLTNINASNISSGTLDKTTLNAGYLDLENNSNSGFMGETSKIKVDGFIYTKAIINTEQTGNSPSGIVFGNGSTPGSNQISMITKGDTRLYIDSSGNVGIGEKLDVSGDVGFSGDLNVTGNINISGQIYGDGSQLTGVSSFWSGSSGSDICYNGGNVGIGTTNPGEKLDVSGIIKTNGLKGYTNSSFTFEDFDDTSLNGGNVTDIFEMGSTNASGANFICDSNGNALGGGAAPEGFAFYSRGGNTSAEIDENIPRLLMYVTGHEGNVGIRGNLVLGREQKHNSSSYKLDVDGTVNATNYIATSDRNLKENIVQINDENIIDKVTSLNGYNFIFKDDETKTKRAGLIAQEVEELMPELVSTNTDGNKSMDYNGIIPYLVECIKVQQTQIQNQQTQIQNQQNQINMLKSKIENM